MLKFAHDFKAADMIDALNEVFLLRRTPESPPRKPVHGRLFKSHPAFDDIILVFWQVLEITSCARIPQILFRAR